VGAELLVMHMGKGEESESQARMVEGVTRAWGDKERNVSLLLENTAGQGREMGYSLEELVEVFQRIPFRNKCGLCIDFCHALAAGYSIHRREGLSAFLKRIDYLAGLKYVKLVHLNDSLKPLGARIDRHMHIGKGEIGTEGFRRIVNHSRLRNVPGILETPRKTDLDDLHNLSVIRSLMRHK
jgi:deoxyribonuclease-4